MDGPQFEKHPSLADVAERGQFLLDAVTVDHGPRKELGQFFLVADAMARKVGADIKIHTDMSLLSWVNSQVVDSWGPLGPMFDPVESALNPTNSFWLSAHDGSGGLIATFAARKIQVGAKGLSEELRELRLHYSNPVSYIEKGAQCIVDGEAATVAGGIKGTVAYCGGSWTTPRARGLGLPYILARVGRNLALTQWNSNYNISLVRVDLKAKGVLLKYGYENICSGIELRNSYRGNFAVNLIWMDRARIEEDLTNYTAQAAQNMALG